MSVWKPSVTVAAVIERAGRFLLVEEVANGRRVLNQPAGHLEPEESLVAACAREVMEETAHRFAPEALVGIYRWHYPETDVTFLRFAFRGRVEGVLPERALDAEIVALHWLSRAELAERAATHRSPLVMRCVDDFLAGGHFPLAILSKDFS